MKRLRKAYKSRGDDVTLSRFVKEPGPSQLTLLHSPRALSPRGRKRLESRPEVVQSRTRFPKSVVRPEDQRNVLVTGHSNAKLGRDVRKGRLFRGYWIFALSLEERATCPRSCHHFATCYGNHMPYAKRIAHANRPALQRAIERDLHHELSHRGRAGVLVRLHALGDFFNVGYVAFWLSMLALHDRLAVYGYTAHSPESAIGRAITLGKELYGRRFAIRWSNGKGDEDCAVPITRVDEPVNAIVCPEQTGRTTACATCGLCWETTRNIAFVEH